MNIYKLNQSEEDILHQQNPETKEDGGWQRLLVKLQEQFNLGSKEITLYPEDKERIKKYAFSYGNGGWEDRLKGIFGRVLGSNLDG
jgi:hypothetical protein